MTYADSALQFGRNTDKLAWKNNMKMDDSWTNKQEANYNRLLKLHNSDEHKTQQRAFYNKKLEELG